MKLFDRKIVRGCSLGFLPYLLAVGLLPGCKGFPTEGEKQARRDLKAAEATYRPNGQKPRLPELNENSGLSNYLTFAMLNQPKVEAAYYDWAASVERITQARSFPDPQFTFQMDIQSAVTSVMPGLMGNIPWPDKLRVGAEVASQESRSKYFNFQGAVLESAYQVKRAYYQLYFVAEKIRVNRETLNLLNNLEELARSQNEVGRTTLQDVLRIQMEQSRLQTEILNLDHSRAALIMQFKGAMGLKADDPAPPMPARFETTSLDAPADKMLETALAENKRLKGIEAEVRAAEASIRMAQKARLPDFSLGLMADVKMNPTLYRFPGDPGTISLPIWRDKIAAQIAEAQANKRSAEARLSAEEIALAVDFVEKWHGYLEATDTLELLENELLPKARKSFELARATYPSGQTDFSNLTETERALLDLELEKVGAAAQREIALAELSLVIQGMSPASGGMSASGARMAPQPTSKKGKTSAM
jgi:outer membrane protein TolC